MQKLYFLLNSKEGTIYEQLMMLRDNIIIHRFLVWYILDLVSSCVILRWDVELNPFKLYLIKLWFTGKKVICMPWLWIWNKNDHPAWAQVTI